MKRIPPSDVDNRFRAHVRHYHRANSNRKAASWSEWVDGSEPDEEIPSGRRLKVVLTLVVMAAAAALVAGLMHVGLA